MFSRLLRSKVNYKTLTQNCVLFMSMHLGFANLSISKTFYCLTLRSVKLLLVSMRICNYFAFFCVQAKIKLEYAEWWVLSSEVKDVKIASSNLSLLIILAAIACPSDQKYICLTMENIGVKNVMRELAITLKRISSTFKVFKLTILFLNFYYCKIRHTVNLLIPSPGL